MRRLLQTKVKEDILSSDDFYSELVQEDLLDQDEISAKEDAFMRGYKHAYDQ